MLQTGQGRPHSSSFPRGLRESPERPSAAGSAGSAAKQVLLFKPVARRGAMRNQHLGLPCSRFSPPKLGYRCCAWDRRPGAAAPGLSSPHPTLPLRYFSMTGARGHFRRGGGVPLARVYQFLPAAPRLLQRLHHYARASSRAAAGTRCAKGAQNSAEVVRGSAALQGEWLRPIAQSPV